MVRVRVAARRSWNLGFVGTVIAAVAVFALGVGEGDPVLQALTVAALLCVSWPLLERERPPRD